MHTILISTSLLNLLTKTAVLSQTQTQMTLKWHVSPNELLHRLPWRLYVSLLLHFHYRSIMLFSDGNLSRNFFRRNFATWYWINDSKLGIQLTLTFKLTSPGSRLEIVETYIYNQS